MRKCLIGGVALSAAVLALSGCSSGGGVVETGNAQERVRQAGAALSLGLEDKAIAHYEAALAKPDVGVLPALELTQLYGKRGDHAAALRALETADKKHPDNLEVLRSLSQAYLMAGDDKRALSAVQRGLRLFSQDIRLQNVRAVLHDRKGEHEAAQEIYRRLLLRQPIAGVERVDTVNNFALSMVASGKPLDAVRLLEPELAAAPVAEKPALRQLLALAHGVNGDEDKAYELALIDLSLSEVEENLRFYREYREGRLPRHSLFRSAS